MLINNTLLLILLIVKTKVQGHTSNWETWLWRLHSGWLEDRAWQSRGEEYRLSLLEPRFHPWVGQLRSHKPRGMAQNTSLFNCWGSGQSEPQVTVLVMYSSFWGNATTWGTFFSTFPILLSPYFLTYTWTVISPSKTNKTLQTPLIPQSKNASLQQLTN